jgi:hypothetical protein
MHASRFLSVSAVAATLAAPAPAQQDGNADLAQQLSNPVASLISVPVQTNYDWGWGADGDGFRFTANVQPVIPVSISSDWNIISRTILPIIAQNDVTGPGTSQFGLGDTVQSLFFSPKAPSASGVVWGAGPVFLVPTATDRALGSGKWGVGPTGVILKISGQTTYGLLANHIWSFAGSSSRGDVSATFVQPFVSYTTRSATTWGLNSEISRDWIGDNWLVPVNATVSQLVVIGKQPVSIGGGFKYWIESPAGGPDWGLRLVVTFLFPK